MWIFFPSYGRKRSLWDLTYKVESGSQSGKKKQKATVLLLHKSRHSWHFGSSFGCFGNYSNTMRVAHGNGWLGGPCLKPRLAGSSAHRPSPGEDSGPGRCHVKKPADPLRQVAHCPEQTLHHRKPRSNLHGSFLLCALFYGSKFRHKFFSFLLQFKRSYSWSIQIHFAGLFKARSHPKAK